MSRNNPTPQLKRGKPRHATAQVPTEPTYKDRQVQFAFKYVDFQSFEPCKFCDPVFGGRIIINHNYVRQLIGQLKAIESITVLEFKTNRSGSLRSHPIDWDGAKAEFFPLLPAQLAEEVRDECFQFELTRNEHGRVHGFFTGNVFNVVWLDPGHELCP